MPIPERPVHTSPHTDTHMHGGNKYFPYQSVPNLIPQVGSLQRGGVKCSVFQGWERAAGERKGRTLSLLAGWRFILEVFPGREGWGKSAVLLWASAALSQMVAKSGAMFLKKNLMTVLRETRV